MEFRHKLIIIPYGLKESTPARRSRPADPFDHHFQRLDSHPAGEEAPVPHGVEHALLRILITWLDGIETLMERGRLCADGLRDWLTATQNTDIPLLSAVAFPPRLGGSGMA